MHIKNLKIYNTIIKEKHIFKYFDEVYLFGSLLNKEYSNDVDLLLIYNNYSEDIQKEKNKIITYLNQLFELEVHLLFLSKAELIQTDFLENTSYVKKVL